MKHIKKALLASLIASSVLASSAFAANVTGNFQATSTLNASCVVSASPLDFGAYAMASIQKVHNINFKCTKGTQAAIGLSAGNTHYMVGELSNTTAGINDKLTYQFYNTIGNVFGNGSAGNPRPTRIATGGDDVIQFQAYLLAGQFVTPGSYADTMVISLVY